MGKLADSSAWDPQKGFVKQNHRKTSKIIVVVAICLVAVAFVGTLAVSYGWLFRRPDYRVDTETGTLLGWEGTDGRHGRFRTASIPAEWEGTPIRIIGEYAFAGDLLSRVTIPEGVERIERYAFWANQLEEITIPKSITDVGDRALQSNMLTRITMMQGDTVLGDNLLNGSDNNFRDAYLVGGAGTYAGTQAGEWRKTSEAPSGASP
ncbi:MAG: leucine-rich repeat domain-containing protein [Clostridia bacterium]